MGESAEDGAAADDGIVQQGMDIAGDFLSSSALDVSAGPSSSGFTSINRRGGNGESLLPRGFGSRRDEDEDEDAEEFAEGTV